MCSICRSSKPYISPQATLTIPQTPSSLVPCGEPSLSVLSQSGHHSTGSTQSGRHKLNAMLRHAVLCLVLAMALCPHGTTACGTATGPSFCPKAPSAASDRVIVKLTADASHARAVSGDQLSSIQAQPLQAGETLVAALERLNARDGELRAPRVSPGCAVFQCAGR